MPEDEVRLPTITVTVVPDLRGVMQRFGAVKVQPYLDELMVTAAKETARLLRESYLENFGSKYTGHLYDSIRYRKRGKSYYVGVIPREQFGRGEQFQDMNIYGSAVTFGWYSGALRDMPRKVQLGVAINKLALYFMTTGRASNLREAVGKSMAMIQKWPAHTAGRDWVSPVVNVGARGDIADVYNPQYVDYFENMVVDMINRIKQELG